MKKVYLAGAINGKSDAECIDWRESAKALLAPRFETLDPMRRDYRGVELSSDELTKRLVEGDKEDIRECFAVIVKADAGPSWGTAMEVIYAREQGCVVVAFVGESRVSPWLAYHAHSVVGTLDDACRTVADLADQLTSA